MAALKQTEKQTIENKLFAFDFVPEVNADVTLTAIIAVTAARVGKVVGSVPVVVSGASFSATLKLVYAYFAQGTSLEDYVMTAVATTTDGQTLAVSGMLLVRDPPAV